MTRFAKKVLLFMVTVALVFAVYARMFIGGEDDNFYRRFTSPPAPSLVVGSSRCAQGIVPSVINESELQFARPLYNYCFTNGHSPYGPYYLQSIQKKLRDGEEGLFIVEVNPWSISVRGSSNSGDPDTFRESGRFIANMHTVNLNPNLEYVIKYYEGPYYKDIYHDLIVKPKRNTILKKSGWLRVDVNMDSLDVVERKCQTFKNYQKIAEKWRYSDLRASYLKKLLRIFARSGDTYMVRMPVSKGLQTIERRYMPDFDKKMESVAQSTGVEYISFFEMSGAYSTTDGNHIWRKDARRLTSKLTNRIDQ